MPGKIEENPVPKHLHSRWNGLIQSIQRRFLKSINFLEPLAPSWARNLSKDGEPKLKWLVFLIGHFANPANLVGNCLTVAHFLIMLGTLQDKSIHPCGEFALGNPGILGQ